MTHGQARSAGPIALKTKITTDRLEETPVFYERVFGLNVVEVWDSPDDRGVILGLPAGHGPPATLPAPAPTA